MPPPVGGPSLALQGRLRDESLLGFPLNPKFPESAFRFLRDEHNNRIAEWALRISYHPNSPLEPEQFVLIRKLYSRRVAFSFTILKDLSLYGQLVDLTKAKKAISPTALSAWRGRYTDSDFPRIADIAKQYSSINLPLNGLESTGLSTGFWYFDFVSNEGLNYSIALPNDRLPVNLWQWLQSVLAITHR